MKNTKIDDFIKKYEIDGKYKERIPNPHFFYSGDEILREAVSAVLAGKNILLVGDKSTGKNVLAENLAFLFKRPLWNLSFHINIDSSVLIGDDTLKNGNVLFREGPITKAANCGGFVVLDEINMAKNEAMAVLHSILDYRRIIDIPGYDLIKLHPATRFIATMNYGYEGTRELNEALLSRFVIIKMPLISRDRLVELIKKEYPNMKDEYVGNIAFFFYDLKLKAEAGEISRHAPDLRGIFDAIDLVREDLSLNSALQLTIANKLFDTYEEEILRDLIKTRFKENLYFKDIFQEWFLLWKIKILEKKKIE